MVEAILLTPLFTSLPGCNQPDNPKMAEAPPPPAPTKEELALPKGADGKEKDYGALPKYQKAFNKNR